jgi:hypothetical protein
LAGRFHAGKLFFFMETDPERPQTLTLPHFPSFFFLAGVKKETHYAERTLIKLSHLPDPHTGTYCIYIFFYDDGRNICVLLVTTSPARQIVSIICINASTTNAQTMIGGGKKFDCSDFTTLQMLVYNRSHRRRRQKRKPK